VTNTLGGIFFGKVLIIEVIVTKVLVGAGIGFILADKPTTIVFSIFKWHSTPM
jgi:hypothetical protein